MYYLAKPPHLNSNPDLLQVQSLSDPPLPRATVLPEGQLEHCETVPPAL